MIDRPAASPAAGMARVQFRLLALQAAGAVAGMLAFGFNYDPKVLVQLALVVGCTFWAARQFTRRGLPDAGFLLQAYVVLFASAIFLSTLSYVFAATDAPYADAALVALDYRLFGFSWLEVARFFARRPLASHVVSLVYTSLAWQPFVLLGLLVLRGRHRDARVFTLAWTLATTACLIAFPFLPALGGALHYGTRATDYPDILVGVSWEFEPLIAAVRSGALRTLGAHPIVGLVNFPSFHAAGAVILAVCARRAPGGPIFLVVNAIMLVSTVPIGGHYLVDVAGGVLIAVASLAAARALAGRSVARSDHQMASRPTALAG